MPENNEEKKIVKKRLKIKVKPSVKKNSTEETQTKPTQEKSVEKAPRENRSHSGTGNRNQGSSDRRQSYDKKRSNSPSSYNKKGGSTGNNQNRSGFKSSGTQENSGEGKNDRSRSKKTTHHKNTNQQYSKKHKRHEEEIALSKMQKNFRQKKGEAVIPDSIEIGEFIKVMDLSKKMNLKSSELIKKLMELGVSATINDTIDADTAQIVCEEYNCKVEIKSLREEALIEEEPDNEKNVKPRSPIVTIMGHVDHGKTKLLDAIRNSDVAGHESGGITQHIGAYRVKTKDGEITFIDTPGHAAFTAMRARGAQVTDIVILVVSAADGVMPQTIEAASHAKAAGVPIVVAINKIDLPEANVERAKQMLTEIELLPEEWGGETMCIPISALKKEGINELLSAVLLQAEMMELKADHQKRGVGYVIESKMDIGKGALATIVVKSGKIEVGDFFVVGTAMGKVRAIFNDRGQRIKIAGPSDPVSIMGFNEVPEAGDKFYIVESDEFARDIAGKRANLKKMEENAKLKKQHMENAMEKLVSPDLQEVKVIIRADVQGSVEAIKHSLLKLKNEEIKTTIIQSAVGAVTESDVMLASAAASSGVGTAILAFRVRVDSIAKEKAESEGIPIRRFSIIYELIDYVTSLIEKRLAPEVNETVYGQAEVQEVFKITGVGKIAGSKVTEGTIKRSALARIFREGSQIWEGKISALKRFQDDVSEVQEGFDCGIQLLNYENMKKGDVIESYSVEEKARKFVASEGKKAPVDEIDEVLEENEE